ncbi:hypothetical protein LEP1GSC034_3863 [Leptospira interrogans str. 2003000735]|uniref:Uncharacterized protein n=2 Tax=Leptospira interrogans TaxID=173 RepID=A0A829DAQ7_LEPIR|nr:hypothetical protein LEP1GSC027_4212 [Leptospira interrogans str. 2002000624]EKQ47595.1 hypothetical protein LEP1GSC026_4663 [Leptospira interrogans str. 2002000623]EMJ67082.1 hypothetical protein LEP1GSC034_3863 [Leptospira interrogans str. 2003000735]EMJ78630.1 hypothetical protein LEP1GSC032_0092 [Leptospira interrogans str. 2002000631]EMY05316.1 hypothetical protein LEP1GSC029_3397 [Leptospira interrogans str. 2002000626]
MDEQNSSPEPLDFIASPSSYDFKLNLELYRLYDNEIRIEFIWELPDLERRNGYLKDVNFLDEPPETGYMGAIFERDPHYSEPRLVFFLSEFDTVRMVSSLPAPKHVTGSKGELKDLLLDFLN